MSDDHEQTERQIGQTGLLAYSEIRNRPGLTMTGTYTVHDMNGN